MTRLSTKTNTIVWAIIACLLWSTAYPSIKLGLAFDTPFHFAGTRFIVSGLLILPFTVRPSIFIRQLREYAGLILWVTLLQIVVNYSCFYEGLNLIPGALGAVIYGAQPLIVAIVAAVMLHDDKITTRKTITIVCGIAGVILISAGRQAFRLGSGIELLGVMMILGGNVASAISNVMISKKGNGLNPFVLSSTSLFLGGIIMYTMSFPIEGIPHRTYPTQYWLLLAWLSFMAAAAFSIWFKLLQRPEVKVSELNLWKFITPGIGALLSWLLIPGESPEWMTIIGIIIITVSLLLFYSASYTENHADTKKNRL